MRNLSAIDENKDLVTKEYADGRVVANPTLAGTESDLAGLQVNGTKYKIPSGGGSSISPYASNPAMDGTASPGASNDYARGDHVHPSDASKLDINVMARTRRNITNDLSQLTTAIAEQNLEKYGYAIGDYFVGPSDYIYTIADLDTFYGGYDDYATLSTHHITLVVGANSNIGWNGSDNTGTGYVSSNLQRFLVDYMLVNVRHDFGSMFSGSWSDHLLSHAKLYTNSTNSWAWSTGQYISALTSVQVHGAPIWDMNSYQTGEGNKQLEVFRKYYFPDIIGNKNWWLRSIASSTCPCLVNGRGHTGGDAAASRQFGVVGLVIFH